MFKPNLSEALVSVIPRLDTGDFFCIFHKNGDVSCSNQKQVMLLHIAEHATVAIGLSEPKKLNLFVLRNRKCLRQLRKTASDELSITNSVSISNTVGDIFACKVYPLYAACVFLYFKPGLVQKVLLLVTE